MTKEKELESKRRKELEDIKHQLEQLLEEEKQRGTPAQERERLLAAVKDDNAEISIMERHIVEAQEKIRQLGEEREQLDLDLE